MEGEPANRKILDNRDRLAELAGYLRAGLSGAETFRLVSAYFSVFGFEVLARELASAPLRTKFLFGEPASAGKSGAGEKPRIRYNFRRESPERAK